MTGQLLMGETAWILVTLGVLVGLDNLQVGAGLGLVEMSRRRRWVFAASFALAETVMPLLGLLIGQSVAPLLGEWGEGVGIGMLALTGILILWFARRGGEGEAVDGRDSTLRMAQFVLPLSLSFDNLFAGVALGTLGFPVVASALIVGTVSGGLCAVGLFAGARLRPFIPRHAEMLSGVYLLLLATLRLLGVGA